MKLASFVCGDRATFGIVEGDIVTDLNPDCAYPSLKTALDALQSPVTFPRGEQFAVSDTVFLPVIPDAEKIFCIGINYREHAEETGFNTPEHPSVFVRFADSLVGHGQPVVRPKVSTAFDFEGELAVVIGRHARYVAEASALSYVAGYSCFAENSLRDFQFHSRQATPGKSFWRSGGFGPWLVTPDEMHDPSSCDLTTRLNGEVMQHSNTRSMIFGVAALISYISQFTPLSPGDVIATGTPSGVGFSRDPKVYMVPGDTLEVEISGVGVLRHGVIDEPTI